MDGYTSSAILYQYLLRVLAKSVIKIDVYLHEGKAHGLEEHYELLEDGDYDLILVPDAGSNDAQYAEQLHCPVLVLDHHIIENTYTPANMVIVNNQSSVIYRNKNLSGAGVVFQFCRALDEYFGTNFAWDYIDLAAIGICGDMMSGLEVENQYIWRRGFANIRNHFIKEIIEKQSFSMGGKVTPITVAFMLYHLLMR